MKKAIIIGSLAVLGLLALFFSLPVTHGDFVLRGTVLVKYLGKEQDVVIPKYLFITKIGADAFYRSKISSITIPNSVSSIEKSAFSDCVGLSEILIPKNVNSIGDKAFAGSGIRTIRLPSSVTTIGKMAFFQCINLTEISMPGVVIIGKDAFEGCHNLDNVTLPDSLTSIEDGAFFSCKALTSITIPTNVFKVGESAFFGCWKLTEIIVDERNTAYCSIEGVLFNKDKTILIQYPIAKEEQFYSIPMGVKEIGDAAFEDCRRLTGIVIPEGVTSFGFESFANCRNVIDIHLPESLVCMGIYTFAGCHSLQTINIPNGIKDINTGTFFACDDIAESVRNEIITRFGEYVFESLPG